MTDTVRLLKVTINGEAMQVPPETTVGDLLQLVGITPGRRVAVEQNRQIIKGGEYDQVPVRDGDQFEIVEFVGGG